MNRSAFLFGSFLDLQLCEYFENLFSVIAGLHFVVFSDADDVRDLTIFADDEGDSVRESSIVQDAISFGNLCVRIAEDWVVEFQRLGECRVLLDRIAACCEVSDVVLTQGLTARTERFTFGRSATGEGFRVPGDDDRLFVLELRKFVGLSVAALHFKFGSLVSDFEFGSLCRHSG